ncbi:MAG: hypothetical protein HDQ88_06505 [Clostridia bacterium]|nr:hypothetical protein [Clostridia bacterium]
MQKITNKILFSLLIFNLLILIPLILSACSSPIYYSLTYKSAEGGKVYGADYQVVEEGDDGDYVTAKSDNGYRFTGWSDGVNTPVRKDASVTAPTEISASFEKIYLEFYSDSIEVRNKIALTDLNSYNLSDLIGYKSLNKFKRWVFDGDYGEICAGYEGDAVELIKNQFNLFGITDVEDIKVVAEYEKETSGYVPQDFKTIAHALGGLDGKSYLNSKEAFLYNYEKGQRFFEVDMCFTTDNIPVCYHFGRDFTYEEFMNSATDGYTPLDVEDFLQLAYDYPDIVIDLDVLGIYFGHYDTVDENYEIFFKYFDETLKSIDNSGSLYERLYLELLPDERTDMYLLAKQYCSFGEFIYAEFASSKPITDDNIEAVCKWCWDNDVKYLSSDTLTKDNKEWIDIMHAYGIYVFVFTYNDPIKMYEFYDIGVDCIFTDFTFI